MALLFALLVAAGLALALLSWTCQGRMLAGAPRQPGRFEPVSVLKPLKGADPGLEQCLESFFRLEHPCHELLFAVAEEGDPAVPVVRRLMAAHPDVPARLVVSSRTVGLNPKVNNLALAASVARHDVLLVSDSNVRVEPGYLADLQARLEDGASLVSSLIRGSGASGLGGRIEALQLNTYVMGGVAAMSGLFGRPCVVGKSMLLRRATLEEIGCWEFLGRYLAEDQVCGEEIARRGGRVVVSGRPVDNHLGRLRLRDAWARHLRWARLRRRLAPAGYASEILLNPQGLALLGLAASPDGALLGTPLATLLGAWAGMSLLAWSSCRRLGTRQGLATIASLEALRSLMVLAAWPLPFLGTTVTWRGRAHRVGRRTLLLPQEPLPSAPMKEIRA